jgi:putative endonuclease
MKPNIGLLAENIACQYLLNQGLKLLEQNFRTKMGEIDLIFQQAETIVFVEVRFRKSIHYGTSQESVDYRKQQKIIKTALFFMQKKHWLEKKPFRFDMLAIHHSPSAPQIEWIKNAFTA